MTSCPYNGGLPLRKGGTRKFVPSFTWALEGTHVGLSSPTRALRDHEISLHYFLAVPDGACAVPNTSSTWITALGHVERPAQKGKAESPGFPSRPLYSRPLLRWLGQGFGESMAEVGTAGRSHCTGWRVLLVAALIKCCMRITTDLAPFFFGSQINQSVW